MNIADKAQAHINRMDVVVKAAELKWGSLGDLKDAVPDDLAEKFERQWNAVNDAISNSRYEDVITLSDGAIRGVWAMEKEAIDAGNMPRQLEPIGEPSQPVKQCGIKIPPKEFWDRGGDELPF